MGHYTGPKGRINRRLGIAVYENNGAVKALERRSTPPGMHVRRGKLSTYGQSLLEKQKLKHFYGLGERMLRRLFEKARRVPGHTGGELLRLCERRLDNIICRGGIAKTRPQARQGIAHGHFLVNGRKVDKPSHLLEVGDIVTVKNRASLVALYTAQTIDHDPLVPAWLKAIKAELVVVVESLPTAEDSSLPVDIGQVVELLSR